jgi:hypothetical protein
MVGEDMSKRIFQGGFATLGAMALAGVLGGGVAHFAVYARSNASAVGTYNQARAAAQAGVWAMAKYASQVYCGNGETVCPNGNLANLSAIVPGNTAIPSTQLQGTQAYFSVRVLSNTLPEGGSMVIRSDGVDGKDRTHFQVSLGVENTPLQTPNFNFVAAAVGNVNVEDSGGSVGAFIQSPGNNGAYSVSSPDPSYTGSELNYAYCAGIYAFTYCLGTNTQGCIYGPQYQGQYTPPASPSFSNMVYGEMLALENYAGARYQKMASEVSPGQGTFSSFPESAADMIFFGANNSQADIAINPDSQLASQTISDCENDIQNCDYRGLAEAIDQGPFPVAGDGLVTTPWGEAVSLAATGTVDSFTYPGGGEIQLGNYGLGGLSKQTGLVLGSEPGSYPVIAVPTSVQSILLTVVGDENPASGDWYMSLATGGQSTLTWSPADTSAALESPLFATSILVNSGAGFPYDSPPYVNLDGDMYYVLPSGEADGTSDSVFTSGQAAEQYPPTTITLNGEFYQRATGFQSDPFDADCSTVDTTNCQQNAGAGFPGAAFVSWQPTTLVIDSAPYPKLAPVPYSGSENPASSSGSSPIGSFIAPKQFSFGGLGG